MIYRTEILCERIDRKKRLVKTRRFFLVEAKTAREAMAAGTDIADTLPIGYWKEFTVPERVPRDVPGGVRADMSKGQPSGVGIPK